jgi:hypothetical protein
MISLSLSLSLFAILGFELRTFILSHSTILFLWQVFQERVSWTICLGLASNGIFWIFASGVAGITVGVSPSSLFLFYSCGIWTWTQDLRCLFSTSHHTESPGNRITSLTKLKVEFWTQFPKSWASIYQVRPPAPKHQRKRHGAGRERRFIAWLGTCHGKRQRKQSLGYRHEL